MITPPINELIDKAGSRYSLVVAVSKRARQIVEGDAPMIEIDSKKAVTIATNEFYQDKIECVYPVTEDEDE
jgi:DNA-directed RNA polymerase subunit omega